MKKEYKKNFKKILLLVWTAVLFCFLYFIGYFDEYTQHGEYQQEQLKNTQEISQKISDFSFENIRELDGVEFFYTPNMGVLDSIVQKIDNADERIFIEVYMFTDFSQSLLLKALQKAKKRWVDVRVLLEQNVYGAGDINKKIFQKLQNSGIDVSYGDSSDYSLNHAKMMIIDDEVILSTGNLTYSTFSKNRDFFIFIRDVNFLQKSLEVFSADYAGKELHVYSHNLVLSPAYSREKIEYLIENAQESLEIYFQYLKDRKFTELLIQRAREVDISIVLPRSSDTFSDGDLRKRLEKSGIQLSFVTSPKIHTKAVLVDQHILFIGSVNMSHYSFDENREVWVLLKNKTVIQEFLEIFQYDFQ